MITLIRATLRGGQPMVEPQATAVRPTVAQALQSEGRLAARRGLRWLQARPDAFVALAIYAASRLWSGWLIAQAARTQLPSIWTGPTSNYWDIAQLWDGQWFKRIAEQGYGPGLPVDAAGIVQQNEWAFFPAFPYTVRLGMWVTGQAFSPTAVVLNVFFGACAAVVLLRIFQRFVATPIALGAIALLLCLPTSPVLQIAYSESLGLLLLALATHFLLGHRYGWAALTAVGLGLARAVVAPFGLMVLAHFLARWWRSRRSNVDQREPLSLGSASQIIGLGLVSGLSTFLWPTLVGQLTGRSDAYQRTQGAWRSSGEVEPLRQAVGIAHYLWGPQGHWWLLVALVALVAVVLSPWGRALGPELGAWTVGYPVYLAVVTEPWTSTYRYLLFTFPLCAILARLLRHWQFVAIIVVICLWGQGKWINDLLIFDPPASFPP